MCIRDRYIVMPQVAKRILPAMGNEIITLVKDTSLAFAIGVDVYKRQEPLEWLPLKDSGKYVSSSTQAPPRPTRKSGEYALRHSMSLRRICLLYTSGAGAGELQVGLLKLAALDVGRDELLLLGEIGRAHV